MNTPNYVGSISYVQSDNAVFICHIRQYHQHYREWNDTIYLDELCLTHVIETFWYKITFLDACHVLVEVILADLTASKNYNQL